MDIIDNLVRDHEIILEALKLLDRSVPLLQQGKLEPATVERLITFLRRFADECHHGKEELCLFPVMERYRVPFNGGPIGVMTCEHGMGRYLLRNARESLARFVSGDSGALDDFRYYVSMYRHLLEAHIDKENNVLFAMARSMEVPGGYIEKARNIERDLDREKLIEEFNRIKAEIENVS